MCKGTIFEVVCRPSWGCCLAGEPSTEASQISDTRTHGAELLSPQVSSVPGLSFPDHSNTLLCNSAKHWW